MHMKNQFTRFSRSWPLVIPAVVIMLTCSYQLARL
jgi:hypothetical protein